MADGGNWGDSVTGALWLWILCCGWLSPVLWPHVTSSLLKVPNSPSQSLLSKCSRPTGGKPTFRAQLSHKQLRVCLKIAKHQFEPRGVALCSLLRRLRFRRYLTMILRASTGLFIDNMLTHGAVPLNAQMRMLFSFYYVPTSPWFCLDSLPPTNVTSYIYQVWGGHEHLSVAHQHQPTVLQIHRTFAWERCSVSNSSQTPGGKSVTCSRAIWSDRN